MTTVPRFTPTPEYRVYRVILDADRWDTDAGRLSVTLHATNPLKARQLAEEEVRTEYPCAVGLRAEVVA
jgi:hypothetical protein